MDNKELRKSIQKILFENYNDLDDNGHDEDLGVWTDFNSDEMMGNAQSAAIDDIEASGETFEPLGKSKFEKNLNIDDMLIDLEARKHIKAGKTLQKLQKQVNQLKRFGGGSLNESGLGISDFKTDKVNPNTKIDRPKDAEGQPITLKARVEDLKTKSVGKVVRFGIDDNGQLTVHVSWISDFGKVVPKSIVYPNKIVVRDDSRIVREVEITDEGIGTSLSMKKGMNIKEEDIDEGAGISLAVKKGMNVKPTYKK